MEVEVEFMGLLMAVEVWLIKTPDEKVACSIHVGFRAPNQTDR